MTSGTLAATTSAIPRSGGINEVSLAWTATAGGAVSQTFGLPAGTLVLMVIIPSSVTAPTAAYTIAITNPNGISLMTDGAGGIIGGASLSATASSWGVPLNPDAAADGKAYAPLWQPGGTCTLTIAAAGSGGQGTVNLYIDPGLV